MKPGMAIDYFSKTPLDGYDPATGLWVPGVALGDFLTFDRFITERTFGQKKRMFLTGELGIGTLPNYDVVRTPDGKSTSYLLKMQISTDSTGLGYIPMSICC